MKRRDEYRKYLKSDEWRGNRDVALERTGGFCQFCGEPAVNVHHATYPKQFGEEHPNTLIPVCKRCHDISHGVQQMKQLTHATVMTDLSPNGDALKYLLSDGRVYASAKSWSKALRVPPALAKWFESGLSRTATLKKDQGHDELEMIYQGVAVYRWHAVAALLRTFDRNWYNQQFKNRPKPEYEKIQKFHESYDRLVNWGYDLQERAINSALSPTAAAGTPVTQETLLEAIKEAVAPRLREHDGKLHEHDIVISEIMSAVPALRDPDEFVTVKQAISEQGLDATCMPLHPKSRETLSGLTGQTLKRRGAEQGPSVIARLDGQSVTTEVNTYRRSAIYGVLDEISANKQDSLF